MKCFFVRMVLACAVMVAEAPAWAQMMEGKTLRSEQKSATCSNWIDVVITYLVPEGQRVEEVIPAWVDVNNVAELSPIAVEKSDNQLRISGRLRGPPPLPPAPLVSEVTCNVVGPGGVSLPKGVSNTGHGAISVWIAIFKK